jgi:Zn-dependent protease with chaperone function
MRLFKLVVLAGLIVGLVPALALMVAESQKRDLSDSFVAAVTHNDPAKITALQQRGITVATFCAQNNDSRFDDACSYLHTREDFELAALGTLALGLLAIAMSLVVPLAVGGNRRLLATVFNPTVRVVTFAVGVAILLQGLLGAYALYTFEVGTTQHYHPKMIGLVGIAGVTAGFLVLRATFSFFHAQPMLALAKRVEATDCPAFFERLRNLCARLSVGVPDNVIVGLMPNFYVTTNQVRLYPSNTLLSGETLYVSLPLCRTFTKPEFDSVLGHELGHFIGEDAIYSQRFAPAYVTLQRAIAAVANSSRTVA